MSFPQQTVLYCGRNHIYDDTDRGHDSCRLSRLRLEVVTAALMNGAHASGGKKLILGSLPGIVAMCALLNGFSLLGLNPFWVVIILGIVLIAIVGQSSRTKTVKMSRYGLRSLAVDERGP